MSTSPIERERRREALSLRQIRYFVTAAETQSVSFAAHELCISQSSVTAAIQGLEQELGATLFVRHSKGLRLTPEGHRFLRHARRVLAAVTDARRAISAPGNMDAGELNIGVTRLVSGYYLADFVARFTRLFPRTRVQVVEDDRDYIEHLLVNGELDLGLMLVSNLRDRQALSCEVLVRSGWRAWLPGGHALLAKQVLHFSDIAEEPMILLDIDELTENTAQIWAREGLAPHIVLRTESVEAVRSLVGMGVGLAALPDMTYRPWSLEGDRLEARDLADQFSAIDVGLVWRKGGPLPAPAQMFLELCREHAPPHGPKRGRE